jgi:hypothetical protein
VNPNAIFQERGPGSACDGVTFMEIDDDTLKQLLRINDELMQLCKWLNAWTVTHILIEAGKSKLR